MTKKHDITMAKAAERSVEKNIAKRPKTTAHAVRNTFQIDVGTSSKRPVSQLRMGVSGSVSSAGWLS
jgi:hypothetical protein